MLDRLIAGDGPYSFYKYILLMNSIGLWQCEWNSGFANVDFFSMKIRSSESFDQNRLIIALLIAHNEIHRRLIFPCNTLSGSFGASCAILFWSPFLFDILTAPGRLWCSSSSS